MRGSCKRTEFGKEEPGGEGVLPVPWRERKPGLILAGIPGPTEELSHGRGRSAEWTGDPELFRQTRDGSGWPLHGGQREGQSTCVRLGLDRGARDPPIKEPGFWAAEGRRIAKAPLVPRL